MPTLFQLTFQGEAETSGSLPAVVEGQLSRAAFPISPPRDASVRDGYRAFKMAPGAGGRVVLSTVANHGDRDSYDRPVLRAWGCILEPTELAGALRDPVAIWQTLVTEGIEGGVEAFTAAVEARSIHSDSEAFEAFRAILERSGEFYARLAAALDNTVDLYMGSATETLERLTPVFGLLSRKRLQQIHLVIGGEQADNREPILALPETAPDEVRKGRGLLSGLFGRNKDEDPAIAVDFASEEVYGSRPAGPKALAAAIADRRPWPVAVADLERYRLLLDCVDAGRSLFEALPELDELRRSLRRLEDLSRELGR